MEHLVVRQLILIFRTLMTQVAQHGSRHFLHGVAAQQLNQLRDRPPCDHLGAHVCGLGDTRIAQEEHQFQSSLLDSWDGAW